MLHPLLMKVPLKTISSCLCGHHDSAFRWRLCQCLQTNGEQNTVQACTYVLWVCICYTNSILDELLWRSISGRVRQYVLRSLPSSDDLFHQRLSWCEHTWQDQRLAVGHTVLSWRCVWLSEWHVESLPYARYRRMCSEWHILHTIKGWAIWQKKLSQ